MSTSASCDSDFSWMSNSDGQDPCTITGWLIELCQDASSSTPANLQPLQTSYSAPNGTSATPCTCSWALYNNIEACTVCQNGAPKSYSDWTSNCDLLGLTSDTSYWPSNTSFSSKTKLPEWSILNPAKWSSGTFNAAEAQGIDNEGLPDVTDASASQPSISSTSSASESAKHSSTGAIVGGVVGGIAALVILGLVACFFLRRRRRQSNSADRESQRHKKHFDLNADDQPLPSPTMTERPLSFIGLGGGGDEFGSGDHLMQTAYRAPALAAPHSQPMPIRQMSSNNTFFAVHPIPAASRRQSESTSQSEGTNVVTNVERIRASGENIPSVAEQLDEKQRLKAAHARGRNGDATAPSAFSGHALGNPHSRQGSRSNISDDAAATNNTVAISHSQSHFFANRLNSSGGGSVASGTGTGMSPIAMTSSAGRESAENDKASPTSPGRRNSLMKSWRRRRARRVMNPGSETHILADVAPLPLNATVAGEGQTTTAGDVVAHIPGARIANARDRENPPPEYSNDRSL